MTRKGCRNATEWHTWHHLANTMKQSEWRWQCGLLLPFCKKGKGSPYSIAKRRVPELTQCLAVSLQVTWVINLAVGCHYFPPCLQLPPQPLTGLLPILLLGEQRHDGCEQFAWDYYPTASRLRFEPRSSAPESSTLTTRLPSHRCHFTIILVQCRSYDWLTMVV